MLRHETVLILILDKVLIKKVIIINGRPVWTYVNKPDRTYVNKPDRTYVNKPDILPANNNK